MGLQVFEHKARELLDLLRAKSMRLALAESCTGGLASAALTEIPGSSDVFDRGFITYCNEAKTDLLGVDRALIKKHGAVSEEVAKAMAAGALARSNAHIAASITGIAGPDSDNTHKPVGLVHFAVCTQATPPTSIRREYGNPGRSKVREQAVLDIFSLITRVILPDAL